MRDENNRALDERDYVGAYSAALILGLISLAMVLGTDYIRRKNPRNPEQQ